MEGGEGCYTFGGAAALTPPLRGERGTTAPPGGALRVPRRGAERRAMVRPLTRRGGGGRGRKRSRPRLMTTQ